MCLPLIAAIPAALGSLASAAGATGVGAGLVGAGSALAGTAASAGAAGVFGALTSTAGIASTLSTALSLGTAGVSYAAQQQQAAAQNRMAVEIGRSANQAYLAQTAAINSRMLQERDASLQQSFNTSIQALQARGRAKAQSAEGGVAGVGLNEVLNDINAQQGRTDSALAYNYKTSQINAYNSEQNAYYQAQDRINSTPFGVTPSLLMPALSTIGGGLSAAAQYGFVPKFDPNAKAS